MTSVLLVHGTGVRRRTYEETFRRFAAGLTRVRPTCTPVPCYWGGSHGSRLNAAGRSIPSGISGRGLGEVVDASASSAPPLAGEDAPAVGEGAEVALWGLLERDPLLELRLLAAGRNGPVEELAPNALPPRELLAAASDALSADTALLAMAAAGGLEGSLPAAIHAVFESGPAHDACLGESRLGAAVRAALARASVAEAVIRADRCLEGTLPLDGAHRDELVDAIVDRLGGSDRGLGASLGRIGLGVALGLGASRPMERRRAAITEAASPAAGDVLMYLTRGDGIRGFIAQAIRAIEGPVVVVGHSLGGIASLEVLAAQHLASVELLITVGSQAPYLYELNALPTLPFGSPLPNTVPRWVNVFDRRDLLAFTGSNVFPKRLELGEPVEDREVDNRAPFPRSHSAYFGNQRFYDLLDEVLP